MLLLILLVIVFFIFLIGYFYIKYAFAYWKRQGAQYIKPEFPYGNIRDMKIKTNLYEVAQRIYDETKHNGSFTGMFTFLKPAVVINDLDLIKLVLIKDFPSFVNRGFYHNEKDCPMSGHLFAIDIDKWGPIRRQVTPTFTAGKMRFMFSTVTKTALILITNIDKLLEETNVLDIKDVVARYTMDVIGSVALGLECNSFKDPTNMFRRVGKNFVETPYLMGMYENFASYYPEIARMIGIKALHTESTIFFSNIVKETVRFRETSLIQRNDFIKLLMDIKNEEQTNGTKGAKVSITMNELIAHAFLFFIAGFETSSATISFALYELSINHELQEKARQDVTNILKTYNGEYTYDAIKDMKYLEQVVNETLRKYAPVPVLTRVTTKKYVEKKTGVVFPKGIFVFIPVQAIQNDPELFPNPDVFDPDRMTEEKIKSRHPMSFLPFGEGPRHCIGLRFGMMQAKIGLAYLLANFKFAVSAKTEIPLKFKPDTLVLQSQNGVWVKIEKLTDL